MESLELLDHHAPVALRGEAVYAPPRRVSEAWLAPWWKGLGRRYGHVFHSMCSYMGSFPPGLPRYLIEQFTEPGDVVVDPFSGRGTAPLEACLAGRHGVGVDLNPLAATLTAVKLDPPTLDETLVRLAELERTYRPEPVGERAPPEIRMLFEETVTLPQILHIVRGELSVVGPRPALPREVLTYAADQRERLVGKPGLTCVWQVSGRADIPFERQVELDVTYLRNRSLLTDIGLILRTIPAVLSARGAY